MSKFRSEDRYIADHYEDHVQWIRESNENYLQVINKSIHLLEKCARDYKNGMMGWCKEIALDADGNKIISGVYHDNAVKACPLTCLLENAKLIEYPINNPYYEDDVYVRARDSLARTIDWFYKGDAAIFITKWNESLEGSEKECKDQVIRLFDKAVERLRT